MLPTRAILAASHLRPAAQAGGEERPVGHRFAATGWVVVVLAACSGTPAATDRASLPSLPSMPTESPATPTATEPPREALELLWESTGEPTPTGRYPATYSPSVDPLTGDIWVSLASDDVIWIFAPDGTFKDLFGRPGDGDGEFEFTRPACRDCPGAGALAFAPDGSLFVADVGNHRIQKFNAEREFETEWGEFGSGESQFADANQIATNGREVFVADDVRRDTQVFDTDGRFLRTLPMGGWLDVDTDGRLLASSGGVVATFDQDGQVGAATDLPEYRGGWQIGLVVDDGGRLFFNYQNDATTNAIGLGELDPSTGRSRVWSSGGETLAIVGDVLFEANYVSSGWPEAVLRAYRLPEP